MRRAVVAVLCFAACARAQDVALPDAAPDAPSVAEAGLDASAPDAPPLVEDRAAPDDVPADVPADLSAPTADAPESRCPAGQAECAGACTAVQVDPRNCGMCGRACAAGERCEAGVCQLTCPTGQTPCMGSDGAAACVNVATDRAHCGRCNNPCAADRACMMGRCESVCPAGQTACVGAGGSVVCASLTTDLRNCGMCGVSCLASEQCRAGSCQLVCPTGQTACAGACVNLATDNTHCGMCGRACAADQTCTAGACRLRCPTGSTECSGVCRDLQTDEAHCGMCGRACAAGQSCVAGVCQLVCPAGQTACAGACVNLQGDPTHCGMCGRACAVGQRCAMGVCALACPAGQTACGSACVTTATDVANCGRCGTACATPSNGTASCSAGVCGFTCRSLYGDCDRVSANGCETSLLSNLSNCGACGTQCGPYANGEASCLLGRCRVSCGAGFSDCDGLLSTGCEANTQTSTLHCGACGVRCLTGQTCSAGACVSPTRVLEAFESGTWPYSPWTLVAAGGTRVSTCAHDGAGGLQDPGWTRRTDVTLGTTGQRLSAWVRFGSGRLYLGFGASTAGAWSLVAAQNTSALILQTNTGYNTYTDVATAAFTFTAARWYRLEVQFTGGTTVTGRLYDSNGTTQLASVSGSLPGLTTGGIALRAFGSTCVDTIELR